MSWLAYLRQATQMNGTRWGRQISTPMPIFQWRDPLLVVARLQGQDKFNTPDQFGANLKLGVSSQKGWQPNQAKGTKPLFRGGWGTKALCLPHQTARPTLPVLDKDSNPPDESPRVSLDPPLARANRHARLGAGVGLPGLWLASGSPARVVLSDCQPGDERIPDGNAMPGRPPNLDILYSLF